MVKRKTCLGCCLMAFENSDKARVDEKKEKEKNNNRKRKKIRLVNKEEYFDGCNKKEKVCVFYKVLPVKCHRSRVTCCTWLWRFM